MSNLCCYRPGIGGNAGKPCGMPTADGGRFCRGCERRVKASEREGDYDQKITESSSAGMEEQVSPASEKRKGGKRRKKKGRRANFTTISSLTYSILSFLPSTLCKLISQYTHGPSMDSSGILFKASIQGITVINISLRYKLTSFIECAPGGGREVEVNDTIMNLIGENMLTRIHYMRSSGTSTSNGRELLLSATVRDPAYRTWYMLGETNSELCDECCEIMSIPGYRLCAECFTSDVKSEMRGETGADVLKKRHEEMQIELNWDETLGVEINSRPHSYSLSLIEYSYEKEVREIILSEVSYL